MPGQPTGEFDVIKLEVVEVGASTLNNIVDAGENFELECTFEGTGVTWAGLETILEAEVYFFAEGMGFSGDRSFGTQTANLYAGGSPYKVRSGPLSITTNGVFRCGCVVNFRNKTSHAPWKGWLGYNEDCVMLVHSFEE
jgi:hypothetical protein